MPTIRYAATPRIIGLEPNILRLPWFEAGSLARHCWLACQAMIADKTPGDSTQNTWSTISGTIASPVLVRNPSVFCSAYDRSGISAMRTGETSNRFPYELITPLHIIASHVGISIGSEIVFVSMAGAIYTRTVVGTFLSAGSDDGTTVARLNSPLPADIRPLKLMPAEPWHWFGGIRAPAFGEPGFGLAATEQMRGHLPYLIMKGNPRGGFMALASSNVMRLFGVASGSIPNTEMAAWWRSVASGDSNGPHLMPINGELVLLATEDNGTAAYKSGGILISNSNTSNGGFYAGAGYVGQTLTVAERVAILGGGYVPQVADLSAFTNYSSLVV